MKLALVQQAATADKEDNVRRGLDALERAARAGVELVAFPELAFERFHPQRPAGVDAIEVCGVDRAQSGRIVRMHFRVVLPSLAFALLAVAACRNIDVVTASYATLDEAQRAGAIDRGWMPGGLPPGAHDIREAHDRDAKRRWGLFSFPVSQAPSLQQFLEPNETSLSGQACDAPGRIEWWPVMLRGNLDAERIQATGLRAYRSAEGNLLFAVNWRQGRAYYWTPVSTASR